MKRPLLTVIKALFISSLFIGCDCYKSINGVVLDNYSGQPVSGAKITIVGIEKYRTTTDSFGKYNLGIIRSGLQCYCKLNHQVLIEKESYVSQKLPISTDKIRLTQYHSKWIINQSCIPNLDTLDGQPVVSNLSIDRPAEFKGGESKLMKYLAENLEYPVDRMSEDQERVNMTFVIDTIGRIRNQCIDKQFLSGYLTPFEENAIKLLKKMPDWIPAKTKGQLVYVRVKIPMRIHRY